MADVITLGGTKVETEPTEHHVRVQIAVLEELLVKARSGTLRGLAIVFWDKDQCTDTRWSVRKGSGLELAGAAQWLVGEIENHRIASTAAFDVPETDPPDTPS